MYIVQMQKVTTKKATEIVKMFEEKTGDSFQIGTKHEKRLLFYSRFFSTKNSREYISMV